METKKQKDDRIAKSIWQVARMAADTPGQLKKADAAYNLYRAGLISVDELRYKA